MQRLLAKSGNIKMFKKVWLKHVKFYLSSVLHMIFYILAEAFLADFFNPLINSFFKESILCTN